MQGGGSAPLHPPPRLLRFTHLHLRNALVAPLCLCLHFLPEKYLKNPAFDIKLLFVVLIISAQCHSQKLHLHMVPRVYNLFSQKTRTNLSRFSRWLLQFPCINIIFVVYPGLGCNFRRKAKMLLTFWRNYKFMKFIKFIQP